MNLLIVISLSRELTDEKDWEYSTEVTVKSQTPWESTSDSGTSVSKGGPGGGVYLWPGIAVGRLAVSIGCDVSSTSSEDKQTDSGKTERCHCVFLCKKEWIWSSCQFWQKSKCSFLRILSFIYKKKCMKRTSINLTLIYGVNLVLWSL